MSENKNQNFIILGISIFLGLAVSGWIVSSAAIKVKEYERTVTAKGLSEREYDADVVIWPISFTAASNDLTELYDSIEQSTTEINKFLTDKEIEQSEITFGTPAITDKLAQQWGGNERAEFRYTALQAVTVYSSKVPAVRQIMGSLSSLGKKGIAFSGMGYENQTEYIFTRLNEVKPEMIEESTQNAREVAQKFATDSKSKLGKIKKAYQGQFTIEPRDKNNPHIMKVRVVSTVEYYLSD